MFYTIYKITNTLDGKIYIGKHQTTDLNDTYMGSGKYLKRAIEKYGISNFKKEILFQFDNEADMNAKESYLVTEEFCQQDFNYNICVGGHGGFSHINRNKDDNYIQQRKNNAKKIPTEASSRGGSIVGNQNAKKWEEKPDTKYLTFTVDFNAEMSARAQSAAAKSKRAATRKTNNFQVGSNNSQFGTMWITNGVENKKIKKDVDFIPEGWYKGYNPKKTQ